MNLKKTIDTDTIQAYTIHNPTKYFKRKFPHEYILSLDILGEHKIFNVPHFPEKLLDCNPIGYIFSYSDIKRKLGSKEAFVDVGNTFTRCLDSYFIGNNPSDNIDIVLACSPKKEFASPSFTNEIIIRCNSVDLLRGASDSSINALSGGNLSDKALQDEASSKNIHSDKALQDKASSKQSASDNIHSDEAPSKNISQTNPIENQFASDNSLLDSAQSKNISQMNQLADHSASDKALSAEHLLGGNLSTKDREELVKTLRKNVCNVVQSYLRGQDYETESWTEYIIYNYPMNSNGLPISYPDVINDKNISSVSVNPKNLFVEYDFRAKSYAYENSMISLLEDAFESPTMKVLVTNTYNGMLDKVKSELKSKHRKFKEVDADTIKVRAKDIRDLNISYEITDFI